MKKIAIVLFLLFIFYNEFNANTNLYKPCIDLSMPYLNSEYLKENQRLVQEYLNKKSKANLNKLPSTLDVDLLLKNAGIKKLSRGDCPSGMSSFNSPHLTLSAKGISNDTSSPTSRKIELYSIGHNEGGCVYIIHVYYDSGFLGLFPTQAYACSELIGC